MGLARCLAAIFGKTDNSKGYYDIHPCIGMIYGDGINFAEQINILEGLKVNKFESTNIVLGMGSYTYQYVTRDTFGTVCKATYCEINGVGREIFKSPKTGAWKKSHKGLLRVNESMTWKESCTWDEEKGGILETVFQDGLLMRDDSITRIRKRA